MSTPKAETRPVGSLWDLPKGEVVVTDPDGIEHRTTGAYVLDKPGVFTCGDQQITTN